MLAEVESGNGAASERGVHAASTSGLQTTVKRPEGRAPSSPAEHRAATAAAARELNALRERWLNPPEWTVGKILEFPGSTGGPWHRYLDAKAVNAKIRRRGLQQSCPRQ